MDDLDHNYDLAIIGSGGAAFAAASAEFGPLLRDPEPVPPGAL